MSDTYDIVVIGAGPAGLSAGLNLVRARRRVLVLDSNRPRHAATLMSHGFLTRDNTPPGELRRIAREEYLSYPEAEHQYAEVLSVRTVSDFTVPEAAQMENFTTGAPGLFDVEVTGVRGSQDRTVRTRMVLVATGLSETLPDLPSIKSFYGMGLFSCVACDGYEYSDRPIALIGETSDLAWRALLIAQWSNRLTVFTNGTDPIGPQQEAVLRDGGVAIERRRIDDVLGDKEGIRSIRLADGEEIEISGGFVRPRWDASLGFLDGLDMRLDGWGLIIADPAGRTSRPGIYAAGDVTSPGPQQLVVAAGAGARAAATMNRDLIGIPTASRR